MIVHAPSLALLDAGMVIMDILAAVSLVGSVLSVAIAESISRQVVKTV